MPLTFEDHFHSLFSHHKLPHFNKFSIFPVNLCSGHYCYIQAQHQKNTIVFVITHKNLFYTHTVTFQLVLSFRLSVLNPLLIENNSRFDALNIIVFR